MYIYIIIHTNTELDIQTLDFFESGAARFLNDPSCFGGWSWWPLGHMEYVLAFMMRRQGVYVKRILGESR